jgi:hypothetical protein
VEVAAVGAADLGPPFVDAVTVGVDHRDPLLVLVDLLQCVT